ncbi:hypothetical protein V6N11_044060 [Hibiscus sabdariffa]|uniref:RNase H type-1 domain-containing protein n=1 Tax=Hibiscus sabdariffa TaxID=183260 RepID=A0ABR2RE40_9ROSI
MDLRLEVWKIILVRITVAVRLSTACILIAGHSTEFKLKHPQRSVQITNRRHCCFAAAASEDGPLSLPSFNGLLMPVGTLGYCAEAIKLIHQDDRLGGSLIIVHHIRKFLKKNWCISYVCINRVNNRVADALATTVNTSDFSLVKFDDPPNFVLPLLQEDMSSFSAPT